jgi:uncharacterized protein (DUF1015 family)
LAEISPFQGLRYNQDKVKDMAAVICPPYDVISPEQQQGYYEGNEYNIIRLEHGLELPDDDAKNNKYTRARSTFDLWLKDSILKVDTAHTFYIYEQGFTHLSSKKKRLGLIACVKLEPWESKVILPHENTHQKAKSDRFELMKACNSNISPILGLYDDPGNKVTKLMEAKSLPSKLMIDINMGNDSHKIWKANEPEFVQRSSHFISPKPIYIADGHHRYETALAYREQRRKQTPSYTGYEAFNFIMMTMVSFSDPGLVMLPIHRLIKGIEPQVLEGLLPQLSTFFEIKATPVNKSDLIENRGSGIRVLGIEAGQVLTLRLLPSVTLDGIMPQERSAVYKKLDVSIVQHLIMEKLLNLQSGSEQVTYTPDTAQAIKSVEAGEHQLAFVLSPMPVTIIKSISDANDRMPPKSTYFYPKLPTGLVLNRLDGKL